MANHWHPATATPAPSCAALSHPAPSSADPSCAASAAETRTLSTAPSLPAPSLLDPRYHHDSCGVGFVARLSNERSREVLQYALTALGRLAHRGAVAADGKSSDGVGIMTQIPGQFLLDRAGVSLPEGR